jgi:hypothetical protein
MKRAIGFAALLIALALLACGDVSDVFSTGLPEESKQVLDKHIKELNPEASYEILSAEKGVPQSSLLGGTADEMWCVTLDREINDQWYEYGSHFYVGRFGLLWKAATAYGGESDFLRHSCSNY